VQDSERSVLEVPSLLRVLSFLFSGGLERGDAYLRGGVDDPDLPTAVVMGHRTARKEVDRDGRHGLFRTLNLKGEAND